MVPKCYQGGEEVEDDRMIDVVYLFPYGVGDSVGTRCRGRGALGKGESNFLIGEGGGGGLFCQASPARQGFFEGEKVVQECIIDGDWGRGIWEGGKPRGLSWVDQLFGRPDVVRGGFSEQWAQ